MSTQLKELQFEADILREIIKVLKRTQASGLKNCEKAVMTGALEEKYALPTLLRFLGMTRSSYYYQKAE